MTQLDQLLAKALSTSSEEEAVACLRMARKKDITITSKTKSAGSTSYTNTYEGYTAKEWRDAAFRLKQKYDKAVTSYNTLVTKYNSVLTNNRTVERALEKQKQINNLLIMLCIPVVLVLGVLLI